MWWNRQLSPARCFWGRVVTVRACWRLAPSPTFTAASPSSSRPPTRLALWGLTAPHKCGLGWAACARLFCVSVGCATLTCLKLGSGCGICGAAWPRLPQLPAWLRCLPPFLPARGPLFVWPLLQQRHQACARCAACRACCARSATCAACRARCLRWLGALHAVGVVALTPITLTCSCTVRRAAPRPAPSPTQLVSVFC